MDTEEYFKSYQIKSKDAFTNTLTLINVCIGLSSIKFALDAKFELSIIAILFAAVFDALDGRVARLLKGTSLVGKELDSLADAISFGVAPAFIMYFWSLNNLGKFGWLLTMIYVVCIILRLARFNVTSNSEPSWRDDFFEGVPSPAGGILILMPLIFSLSEINLINVNYEIIVPIFFILISFLLISKVPTFAFKRITIPRRMTIFALFGVVLFFGLLLIYTFKVLVICGLIYICLIPIGYFNYQKIYKQEILRDENNENDELEDIL